MDLLSSGVVRLAVGGDKREELGVAQVKVLGVELHVLAVVLGTVLVLGEGAGGERQHHACKDGGLHG